MKQNFIRTTDAETAKSLIKLGFHKVSEYDGIHVFLNCSEMRFDNNVDETKIQYTNMLYV